MNEPSDPPLPTRPTTPNTTHHQRRRATPHSSRTGQQSTITAPPHRRPRSMSRQATHPIRDHEPAAWPTFIHQIQIRRQAMPDAYAPSRHDPMSTAATLPADSHPSIKLHPQPTIITWDSTTITPTIQRPGSHDPSCSASHEHPSRPRAMEPNSIWLLVDDRTAHIRKSG
ncbi:hypothetical protein ACLOJK_028393 [Asimina triloba]